MSTSWKFQVLIQKKYLIWRSFPKCVSTNTFKLANRTKARNMSIHDKLQAFAPNFSWNHLSTDKYYAFVKTDTV